ncbi:anti-sigma factor family protein [Gorillibacterium massiliense]|uniref:anti-sigma factor family protein n=1 Tax=Gorillibacterium massiliense TaxID=1280390 RepID=UPI0004AEA254|nr:zf-HC2 domain-containing protein [Gorillibacterium massiliense]
MNCSEVQELFGNYFDLPEDDSRRILVDKHISECVACAEEFRMWEESYDLIRAVQDDSSELLQAPQISSSVMDRIYKDEGWRTPVSAKMYAIPFKLRRNLTAVIALCIAIFAVSFIYVLTGSHGAVNVAEPHQALGVISKPASYSFDSITDEATLQNTAVASIGFSIMEPMKWGNPSSTPNYWLVMSLIGFICTLLFLNWFSRTRA